MVNSGEEFTCVSHVKNPLNGFHLVKRTALKWPRLVESLQKSMKLKKIKSGKCHVNLKIHLYNEIRLPIVKLPYNGTREKIQISDALMNKLYNPLF